jgi:NADPH:quinone reductase-like Zn-dependent oxidoreductase
VQRRSRSTRREPEIPARQGEEDVNTLITTQRLADIEELSRLAEAGQLTPSLDRSYPLAEAPEAIDRLSTGQARGKIVITV